MTRRSVMERVWQHTVKSSSGCWEWASNVNRKGYGIVNVEGRFRRVHRLTYEDANGPIPDGLQLDHLCRNRRCVNPSHLEAVTRRENILRGTSLAAQKARQTHCKYGHAFTPENTYIPKLKPTMRECRECKRRLFREYAARRRAREAA